MIFVSIAALPPYSVLLGAVSLSIWVYLLAWRGGFWRVRDADEAIDGRAAPTTWPAVIAVVPARNEAATVGRAVASLLQQDYAGQFGVVVVDDHSADETARVAEQTAAALGASKRLQVVFAREVPPSWTGKAWALNKGVSRAATCPEFYWFTDADIVHAPDTLRRLMARAERERFDLTSLMVLLQCRTFAERMLIPAFLFFFLKLYPPKWIAQPGSRTAGAAGGCILIRGAALERIGGLKTIRSEVIDDCALAGAVKRSGGRIWMGLTRRSKSLREYATFGHIERMIARTAFTQLRYSALLLSGTVVGLFVTYLLPILLLFSSDRRAQALGIAAWLLIALLYLPTVRFYRRSALWALALPLVAAFYVAATIDSALRYWRGRGAPWKGRTQAPRPV
jgi:hopene-associated glycosyltransferase HpnB